MDSIMNDEQEFNELKRQSFEVIEGGVANGTLTRYEADVLHLIGEIVQRADTIRSYEDPTGCMEKAMAHVCNATDLLTMFIIQNGKARSRARLN